MASSARTGPGRDDVFDFLLWAIDAVLTNERPDYVKWDHNRDLILAVDSDGRGAVHEQTAAFYRLLDALRSRHPQVEFESCASGGARIDLEVLEHTDRVWPSDTIDPLERQRLQRWTTQLLPPELIGSYVGPQIAHTSGRWSTPVPLLDVTVRPRRAGDGRHRALVRAPRVPDDVDRAVQGTARAVALRRCCARRPSRPERLGARSRGSEAYRACGQ